MKVTKKVAEVICQMEEVCHDQGQSVQENKFIMLFIYREYPDLVSEYSNLPWEQYANQQAKVKEQNHQMTDDNEIKFKPETDFQEKPIRPIPIMWAHDDSDIIGMCTPTDKGIEVKFVENANVTRAEFFNMLGCGAVITEVSEMQDLDHYIIKSATILQFRLERV